MRLKGLNKEILAGMSLLLLILGLGIAFTTQAIVFRVLKTQFKSDGIDRARTIAANSLVDFLTMNTGRLEKMAENEIRSRPDTAYLFLATSSGDVLAHTFHKGFPKDLMKANPLPGGGGSGIRLVDTGMGVIYDIASPIILDKNVIGQVRLGIKQSAIQKTIRLINLAITALTLVMVLIGAIITYKFSGRLHGLVEEVRALSKFKERERIALDLHDGLAQNLVSIIKRAELCEKLFKADPEEAMVELLNLKYKTKDILNETRQAIFDIKSRDGENSAILERVRAYLKDYERINNITVKIKTSGALDNIPADKSRDIFRIITEALNNAGKHSFAKNVTLDITNDDNILKIVIEDDGRGFDVDVEERDLSARPKFGLAGMRGRAEALGGKVSIRSEVNKGTIIGLEIPLG